MPKPKPNDSTVSIGPTNDSTHASKDALEGQGDIPTSDKDNIPTINDAKPLVIKTSRTILLVGETGVGKSSLLELIANALAGNDIDHYDLGILGPTNEQGRSTNQSKTNSSRVYQIASKNGIVVSIVDTPGFTDTRCPTQDELQKKGIETQIKKHANSTTAVLVVANGTVPDVTVGTNHVLSALFSVFGKSPTNVAFVLTNVSNPLCENFSADVLRHAPRFALNNPVSLQRKYLELKDDPTVKKPREMVLAEEQNALGVLVELFDWMDGLDHPHKKWYDLLQSITAIVDQVALNWATTYATVFASLAGGTRVGASLAIWCEGGARN